MKDLPKTCECVIEFLWRQFIICHHITFSAELYTQLVSRTLPNKNSACRFTLKVLALNLKSFFTHIFLGYTVIQTGFLRTYLSFTKELD